MSEPGLRKRRACTECAKARKKCDKLRPHCRRCLDKDLDCRYLITVPALVYDESAEGPAEDTEAFPALEITPNETSPSIVLHEHKADEKRTAGDTWLLSPTFWHIDAYTPRREPSESFNEPGLHFFIRSLQNWLKQWVTEGSCPIIHPHLYHNRLPDVLQIAYTSVTAYFARNDRNRIMILHIIEDRCNALIEERTGSSEEALDTVLLDTMSHLARTQALVAYLVVQLFDGDIRSRAQGEARIDMLNTWASQMWESACLDVSSASVRHPETEPALDSVPFLHANVFTSRNVASSYWQAWIIAESVRRTYLAAQYASAAYLTLKNGIAMCPGGAVFTGRSGMWDATSAYACLQARQGPTMVFMSMCQADEILEHTLPSDVDDFTHTVLTLVFGLERIHQWLSEKGGMAVHKAQTRTTDLG